MNKIRTSIPTARPISAARPGLPPLHFQSLQHGNGFTASLHGKPVATLMHSAQASKAACSIGFLHLQEVQPQEQSGICAALFQELMTEHPSLTEVTNYISGFGMQHVLLGRAQGKSLQDACAETPQVRGWLMLGFQLGAVKTKVTEDGVSLTAVMKKPEVAVPGPQLSAEPTWASAKEPSWPTTARDLEDPKDTELYLSTLLKEGPVMAAAVLGQTREFRGGKRIPANAVHLLFDENHLPTVRVARGVDSFTAAGGAAV